MRLADRWIGTPMCGLLTLARRIGGLVRRRPAGDPPRRIAVLKLAEQGATVLAYPALVRARDRVGAENLFFVVFAQNRFILDLLDIVPPANVITIRTEGLVRAAFETLRAVRRMRREGIEATLDFEFFARSTAILAYLSGARIRVGYHAFSGEASYRGDLLTHRLSFNPFLHASQMYQVIVQAIDCPTAELPAVRLVPPPDGAHPTYVPDPARVEETQAILSRELGVAELPPLILLNANCGDLLPLRRWPEQRYAELARRLLARYPQATIVFTGPPEEARATAALAASVGSPRCVSLAGRTTLAQLIALYEISELLVTNDSGPAHYAALTSVDVITLFGPETPAVFGSLSRRSHELTAGLACSPCVNAFNDRQSGCTNNLCMQAIGVDEVSELAFRVLDDRGARRAPNSASPE